MLLLVPDCHIPKQSIEINFCTLKRGVLS